MKRERSEVFLPFPGETVRLGNAKPAVVLGVAGDFVLLASGEAVRLRDLASFRDETDGAESEGEATPLYFPSILPFRLAA